jgi:hypothetical protein
MDESHACQSLSGTIFYSACSFFAFQRGSSSKCVSGKRSAILRRWLCPQLCCSFSLGYCLLRLLSNTSAWLALTTRGPQTAPQRPQVFCLPDGYEVVERSLDDIRHVLDPAFTPSDVAALDSSVSWARTLEGAEYMPGLLGLNDMRANDYANVIIQARRQSDCVVIVVQPTLEAHVDCCESTTALSVTIKPLEENWTKSLSGIRWPDSLSVSTVPSQPDKLSVLPVQSVRT